MSAETAHSLDGFPAAAVRIRQCDYLTTASGSGGMPGGYSASELRFLFRMAAEVSVARSSSRLLI
jgi:hypothetical protein